MTNLGEQQHVCGVQHGVQAVPLVPRECPRPGACAEANFRSSHLPALTMRRLAERMRCGVCVRRPAEAAQRQC